MFRKMRRFKQELTQEEAIQILNNNTSGVLALLGEEGYPYSVPMSYVYVDNKIYFHTAKSGHKIDAIKNYNKASFCVIDQDQVMPEVYTTFFRSVIAFGKIRLLETPEEIIPAIEKLAVKYHPTDMKENRDKMINRDIKQMGIIELEIEHLTGKEAIELVRNKQNHA